MHWTANLLQMKNLFLNSKKEGRKNYSELTLIKRNTHDLNYLESYVKIKLKQKQLKSRSSVAKVKSVWGQMSLGEVSLQQQYKLLQLRH